MPPVKPPPGKKATKKAPARKAPAKKAAAKQAAAKQAAPRKAPAKKAPAKKAPVKAEPRKAQRRLSVVQDPPEEQASKQEASRSDEVDVFDPPVRAWQLRQAGLPWREVAQQAGYSSVESAINAVSAAQQKALLERGADARHMALQLSVDRLEAMIAAFWTDAIAEKKVEAARMLLSVIIESNKLQRLYEPEVGAVVPRTIVIAGSEAEYVAGLKAVVESQEHSGPAK